MTSEEMAGAAMEVLSRLFGDAIPQPTASIATKWGSDEFARGVSHIITLPFKAMSIILQINTHHHAWQGNDMGDCPLAILFDDVANTADGLNW